MPRLLDPTNSDASPEGLMPQADSGQPPLPAPRFFHEANPEPTTEGRLMTHTAIPSVTTPALQRSSLLVRRVLSQWVAAAIAYRERQAELFASHRPAGRRTLDKTRIYRGPIDQAIERAAQLRKRSSLQ